uniref:RRM domain-containing protein n=2 Tax=Aegilops tauschii subsp. strangulata TaxID=200361 RepID=A0A453RCI1_AEGTS
MMISMIMTTTIIKKGISYICTRLHGIPYNDHWEKHDYTRKIFVGCLPLTVHDAYLSRFFSTEFGPVEEAIVITFSRSTEFGPMDEIPRFSVRSSVSRSPLTGNITENAPYNTDSPHGDACSESNVHSQHDDECSRSNGESLPDGESTSNGSLLYVITVSIVKYDLIESSAAKPNLIVSGPPEKIEQGPLQKPDLVESAPTKKLDLIESSTPRKADLV